MCERTRDEWGSSVLDEVLCCFHAIHDVWSITCTCVLVSGYVPKSYVPLYVRTTLFESNGTSESGDQTYAAMAKDRRYSAQLGRAMASLEPLPPGKKGGRGKSRGTDEGSATQGDKPRPAKMRLK